MRKKLTIYILAAMLLIASTTMTGCGSDFDEEAANQLEEDVYGLYEDFQTFYADSDSVYQVSSYLFKWANDNNLVARKLSGGNLIITKPPSVNDPSFPYTVIQCAISLENPKESSQVAAIALAAVKNLKENGKIGILFTATNNGEHTGAQRISADQLDADYFIHLESAEKSTVNVGSAATAEYEMSYTYEMSDPTATNAYQLSISGLSEEDSSVLKGAHPNAILLLSNFLIGCRASGMLVEIADFDGGKEAGTYPSAASATIMVNQNNEAKLLSRFASSLENFTDKYGDDFPDLSYTLLPVTAPVKVIQSDDAANLLSLLYTTINGVYKTSEEDGEGTTLAVANIGKLSTTSNKVTMNILARSVDDAILKEMAESYHATAFLSDAAFRTVRQTKAWPSDPEQDFAKNFIKVAKDSGLDGLSVSPTFLKSECVVFYTKKKDINMISFSVNNNDSFQDAKALLFFMTSLVHVD